MDEPKGDRAQRRTAVNPHLIEQTRPSICALAALELFSLGVFTGWTQLNTSAARSTWPAAAGLAIGAVTWFTNRTISPDDDRLTFDGPRGGLDDVALVAVLGVAAAVILGLAVAAHDRSWFTGALVTSIGWAALGARVLTGSDGTTLTTAHITAWIFGTAGLVAHHVPTSRRHRTTVGA